MATKKKVKVKKPRATDFKVEGDTPGTIDPAAAPAAAPPIKPIASDSPIPSSA